MNRQPQETHRRAERGSAYIIALLVLVVLTVTGLALTLLTQTEVQIGAGERSAARNFYASDSGPNVSLAGHFARRQNADMLVHLNAPPGLGTISSSSVTTYFTDEVTVTPMVAVSQQDANWTDSADAERHYKEIVFVVNSTATRTGVMTGSSGGSAPLVQKTIGTFLRLQPQEPSIFQLQGPGPTQHFINRDLRF